MGNQYTFKDEELLKVEDSVYETEQILEFEGKTFRLTLTKEELPTTYNLDLFYEENEKLKLLESEYNTIMQNRQDLFEKIKESNLDFELPDEEICFNKDINKELRDMLNEKENSKEQSEDRY